jgi:hypothetical protein
MKITGTAEVDQAYTARRSRAELVEVPALSFLMVDGHGAPGGDSFVAAVGALYSISYAAHFIVKARDGEAPRVMPLEGLWWVEGLSDEESSLRFAGQFGGDPASLDASGWRLMIAQLAPIDAAVIAEAIQKAEAKAPVGDVSFETWREGTCFQILHVGPYSTEAPTIRLLHDAIAAHGSRPRGHHHEIYLGDPRRSAPDRLRTIIRQPIE